MPDKVIGKFVIDGPEDRIDLVKRALDRLDSDVDVNHFIRQPFNVVFRDVKNVPGTQTPAYGFFFGGKRELQIRHGMEAQGPKGRNLRKNEVMYTFLHEALGHGGELDGVLTKAKRLEIMAGMGIPLAGIDPKVAWRRGSTPANVPMRYWDRPYEAYCDLLVAAVSDVPALFEHKYTWDIEPARLKEIVLRNVPPDQDPDPVDEPDPLDVVGPKTDQCAEIRTALDEAKAERDALAVKVGAFEARMADLKQRLAALANL